MPRKRHDQPDPRRGHHPCHHLSRSLGDLSHMRIDTDRTLAEELQREVARWQHNSPRSLQTGLGPSQIGGCRELIRATISGEIVPEPADDEEIGLAALVGTAVGEILERALKESNPGETITQERIVTKLPRSGVVVAGSSDVLRRPGRLYDWKTKAGLEDVRRYGSSDDQAIQLAVYFLGGVQMGLLDESSLASLVYVDRSGRDVKFETATMDYEQMLGIIDVLEDRLESVVQALAAGSPEQMRFALRDKPPSWCFAVKCPMRAECWKGSDHYPTGAIEHEVELDAVNRYIAARDLVKDATEMQKNARIDLLNVEGITPDGVIVAWSGPDKGRIDVRKA